MQTQSPIVFRCMEVNSSPRNLTAVRKLLADSHLEMDGDITTFVEARLGNCVVGCAGLAGNVIKCVAVAPQFRGKNLSAQLLTEVENVAVARGHLHLFLYTKPCNRERFEHSGFWPIVQSANDTILMENIPSGIQRYCRTLQAYRVPGKRIGAIVMNANPFTLGHRHLVELAAKSCDWLHLFVVREDASFFPFSARLNMVNMGVSDLANVTVHQGSQYIISRATFPTYFLKDSGKVQQAWSETDLLIFRNYIVPALGITHRFIGSEPFCDVTHQYNQTMHQVLADAVEVVEIPRIKVADKAISASEVRRLLKTDQFSRIRKIVPDTTFTCLESDYARKSQKNQEYHYENC